MDHDHGSRRADADSSAPTPAHDASARSGASPAVGLADADADAARRASRELDAGMPASSGLDDPDDRETPPRSPSMVGPFLSQAKQSTVLLPYEFVFRRVIDLPPLIVWDAVSDADLVSGWLAEASIDPREGGEFWFEWMSAPDRSLASSSGGVITRFDEGHDIEFTFVHEGVATAVFLIHLDEVPGGPRDRQTGLTVTVTGLLPAGIANVLKASWRLHLDLLEGLVHGRPVDWDRSEIEHGPTWRRYLAELESAEG